MLEAKDDEEKEIEVDGEVEERESHSAHTWDMGMTVRWNEAQTRDT